MTSSLYGISFLDNFTSFITQKIKAKSRGIHFYYSRKIDTLELDHRKVLTDIESKHIKVITDLESNYNKALDDFKLRHDHEWTGKFIDKDKEITALVTEHNKKVTELNSKIACLESLKQASKPVTLLTNSAKPILKPVTESAKPILKPVTESVTESVAPKRPAIEPIISEPKKSKIEHHPPNTSDYKHMSNTIEKTHTSPPAPSDTYDSGQSVHPGLNRRIPNPTDYLKTVESSYFLGRFDFVVNQDRFNSQGEWIVFCSNYVLDFIINDLHDKPSNYKYSLIQIHGVIGRFCGGRLYYNIRNNISAPIIEHLTQINRYKSPG